MEVLLEILAHPLLIGKSYTLLPHLEVFNYDHVANQGDIDWKVCQNLEYGTTVPQIYT